MKKRCKVIRLETKGEAVIYSRPGHTEGEMLGHLDNPQIASTINSGCKGYHLYILSDEEIKEGDWVHHTLDKVVKYTQELWNIKDCKKIIAATDLLRITVKDNFGGNEAQHLPKPSNEFLQKYCELGGNIKEVEVEYEEYPNKIASSSNGEGLINGTKQYIKVTPDNTVTTHLPKDNWSREEVIKLLTKLDLENGYSAEDPVDFDLNSWIKDNL